MIYTFQSIYVNIQTYTNVLSFFLFYLSFIIILPLLLMLGATCTCYGLFQLSESWGLNVLAMDYSSCRSLICHHILQHLSVSMLEICFTKYWLYYASCFIIECEIERHGFWFYLGGYVVPGDHSTLCHCAFTVAIIYCRHILFRPLRFIAPIKKKMGFQSFDCEHTWWHLTFCLCVCTLSGTLWNIHSNTTTSYKKVHISRIFNLGKEK